MAEISALELIGHAKAGYDRFHDTERPSKDAEQTRLIWFVGIAGYVLFNGQPVWQVLLGRPPRDGDLFWLCLPWVVTAIVSAIALTATSVWIDKYNVAYYALRAELDYLLITEKGNDPLKAVEKLTAAIDGSDLGANFKNDDRRWRTISLWLQHAAFASLLISFVWAIWGPFRLR